jgi:hypothetical protein
MSGQPSEFQRYVELLARLGLAPGANIDAIRKAWRERMRQVHPDRFPGNKAKEQQAKALNEARDRLEEMAKDGRLQTFATVAERTRRTGGTDTIGGTPSFTVLVVIAPAGTGKTLGWVKSVSLRGSRRPAVLVREPLHIVMASPTISLIDQTASELALRGLQAPLVKVIHSENVKGSVSEAMRAYYDLTPATKETILLCSHQAIFDNPLPRDPSNWDIVFDEMPDCVTFLQIDAPDTHFLLTNHVTVSPLPGSRLYHLSPQGDEYSMGRLNRIAINRPVDGGLTHLQNLARALVHGHTVLVPAPQWAELLVKKSAREQTDYAGHLDILVIVPPVWFQQYRSVTMMGARCLSHFTALVWRKIWQVEFREDNRFNLPRKHSSAQSRRLTIAWIFEERVTRAFLARRSPNHSNLFMATCESAAKFYDGKPFLWSAPQYGDDKEHGVQDAFWSRRDSDYPDAFHPSLRLPGRTHGLNRPKFLDTYNVALLSVVNLTPAQYELLYQLELTNDEIDMALAFDVAYQDMARCNIRLTDSNHTCHVTVLDNRQRWSWPTNSTAARLCATVMN